MLLRVEGRDVLGFHIDTLNTIFFVSFLWKNTEKTLVISLVCSLSSNKRKSSLVVNNRINKKRFIFTLLRYNAFYRVCSHHSLSTALFFFLSGESYRKRSGKITR